MRSMIGRNGFIFVAAMGLGLMVTFARSGSLEPPAGPANPSSAMFTLNDIYNKLNTWTNIAKRTGGFTEPADEPTNGTMHTLDEIMTLATNSTRALAPKTGQTPTAPSFTPNPAISDGKLQCGAAWPNPRFTAVATTGAETNQIRDNLTGLIWARNANIASGTKVWLTAFDAITNLASGVVNKDNYGGTNDWRLPNLRELYSLIAFQYCNPALSDGTGTNQWTEALGPFTGVRSDIYWSSTTLSGSPTFAMGVYLTNGFVNYLDKTTPCYVWPVRSGR